MNRPEDFDQNQNKSTEPTENSQSTENRSNDEPRNDFCYGQQEPRWYGISYQNGESGSYAPPPMHFDSEPSPPPRKGKRIALVAFCVALCVAFSALAGFAGSLLADRVIENADSGYTPGNTTTGAGVNLGGDVYSYEEGSGGFDYTTVTLQKNDGSGLANAKTSAGDNAMDAVDATAAVKDAVVEIMTTATSNYGTISAGAGSGVIIHSSGVIVTNNHVIDGATSIYVRLTNGNTYEAVVRGTDEDGDIAIIKITPKETLTVAKLGYSGALALSEEVIAIGNPLGELGGTVTHGRISALEREIQVDGVTMTLIQTDAPINSGNSGGGLFNLAGELIGIVNAKYSATGVEGLGFAIPIDSAVISIHHLLELGYIPGIPALGAELIEKVVTFSDFSRMILPCVTGVSGESTLQAGDFIYSVGEGSNAVVVAVGVGSSESATSQLKNVIRSYKVGDTVTLNIYRNGTATSIQVTLVEYIPDSVSVNFQ